MGLSRTGPFAEVVSQPSWGEGTMSEADKLNLGEL